MARQAISTEGGAILNQLLCSRIRIVNFVLNSKMANGGKGQRGRCPFSAHQGAAGVGEQLGPPTPHSL